MRLPRMCSLGVIAAMTACSEPLGLQEYVEVSLTIESAVVRHDVSTDIMVTVTNDGFETLTIPDNPCFPLLFVVFDAEGQRVGPETRICDLSARIVELSPGETHSFEQWWSGRGDSETPGAGSRLLPPGTYTIVGTLGPAVSEPVTVQVQEAPGSGS